MSKITEEVPSIIESNQVLNRVNALLKLQDQHEDLNEAMQKEIMEIEKKYAVIFAPLYTKRSNIVSGTYEPTGEESKTKTPHNVDNLEDFDVKGIPNFWYNTLINHSQFKDLVTDVDKEALASLVDIQFNIEKDSELKADFIFSENPFFTNTVITKTVVFDEEEDSIKSIESTPIEWKEGKNFTVKKVSKKVKSKGKGKKPTFTVQTVDSPVPCFFGDFLNPIVPDDLEEEEEDGALDQYNFMQYQCLITLKDVITPNAVNWFLGRAQEEEENGYGDFDFDEDFEDEDEEDDEEDEPVQNKRSAKSVPQAPTNQDCKQQ